MDRRRFLETTGAALAATSLAAPAAASAAAAAPAPAPAAPAPAQRGFPAGFLWGTATASYQVEGAVHEGGRGQTNWDTFSHIPGNVLNGDTGDVADDFYHRFPQDIAMMKQMGIKALRFSVGWSRIFPSGRGQPNQAGVDFYKRLCDGLLEAGVTPFCTLYHWDLPQALEDKGGWRNRDTAQAFGEYAGYFGKALGSRITHYMTINELRSFVELGYRDGKFAPGLKLDKKAVAQLNHYAVLAHGLGVEALRAQAPTGTKIGIADNATVTVPVIETPEHIAAARKAMREENASYLSVILDGRYSDLYLKTLGADAPVHTPAEMKTISAPLDFVGLNVYQPTYVRAATNEAGYERVDYPASYPHMYSPWLYVGPEALYWSPRLVTDLWHPKEIFITENGASSSDTLAADGHIYDTDRVMYLRNYLTQLERAIAEGAPVHGYLLWSLLDNFEWADGYSKRFGIVYVDFKTQQRTLKLSAEFYRAVIAANAVR